MRSQTIGRLCAVAPSGPRDAPPGASSPRRVGSCVPPHEEPAEAAVAAFGGALRRFARLTVLTGAGVSTESGVPDYRSAGVGLYARSGRRPTLHAEFVGSAAARRRYWARSCAGWPRLAAAAPNAAHHALAAWQRRGRLAALVTQNVDGLHARAGARPLVELHGSAHRVRCLDCAWTGSRLALQHRLQQANPGLAADQAEMRPDGDVELSEEFVRNFVVPCCTACGGVLQPDVVFFGDSVPRERVQRVCDHVADSDALLVVGSSLHAYSAYRLVLQAVELGRPVFILNIGATRGDRHAALRLDGRAGHLLPRLCV